MPRTLTQEEVDRYYEQGYLVLHDVIPQEILDAARAETDRMVAVASTLTEAIPMLDPASDRETSGSPISAPSV